MSVSYACTEVTHQFQTSNSLLARLPCNVLLAVSNGQGYTMATLPALSYVDMQITELTTHKRKIFVL